MTRLNIAYLEALLEAEEHLAVEFEEEIEPLWSGWKFWRWPSYFRRAGRNLAERERLLGECRRLRSSSSQLD